MNSLVAWILLKVRNLMGPTLAGAGSALQGWGGKVASEFNKVAGRTFGIAQAFTFIKGSMEESLNRAKQYVNLGKRMGMPAEMVAQLERYSETAGINVVSLGKAMTSLQKNAGAAMADMNGKMGGYFKQLGMTVGQMNLVRQGGIEAFIEIRKQMEAIPSQAERNIIWIALLGERFTELKDFLGLTAEEMEELTGGQIAMGANTIQSVANTQKAWGNMFAELSALVGDFLRDAEPIIGFLRIVLNGIMMLFRGGMMILGVFSKLLSVVINLGKMMYYLSTGNFKGILETGKQISDVGKEMTENLVDSAKGFKRDWKGMKEGYNQMSGDRSGMKMPQKNPLEPLKDDRRTLEDKLEYGRAMRNQEVLEKERENSLLSDGYKIANMKKILELQEWEEELMRAKYGTEYKQTKEYLEYLNKRLDKVKEIENLEYEFAQKRFQNSVSWIDLANEYYLKEMELTYKSEAEIREEKARQAVDKIGLLQKELDVMLEDKKYNQEEDIEKKQQEIFKLASDTAMMIRKPIDNLDYKADSLQSVGGGGNVSVAAVSIAKAQLMQQEETNKWLQVLNQQIQRSGALTEITNANTYVRGNVLGRR